MIEWHNQHGKRKLEDLLSFKVDTRFTSLRCKENMFHINAVVIYLYIYLQSKAIIASFVFLKRITFSLL